MAQTRIEIVVPGTADAETLQRLTAQLPEGATVATETSDIPPLTKLLTTAADASSALPGKIAEWWTAAGATHGLGPLLSLLLAAAVLAAAFGLERLAIAQMVARLVPATGTDDYSDRARRAFWWGLGQTARLIFFVVAAGAGLVLVRDAGSSLPELGGLLLVVVLRFRALIGICDLLLAPSDVARRLTSLTDDEARGVMASIEKLLVALAVLTFLRGFVGQVVGAGESGALFSLIDRATELSLVACFFLTVRKPFARLIGSTFAANSAASGFRSRAARNWHFFYVGLAVLALIAEGHSFLVPGADFTGASRSSMTVFVLAPFAIAGLRIWCDMLLARTEGQRRGLIVGIFALLEGLTIVLVAVLVLLAWRVDPFAADAAGAQRIVPRLVTAGLVIAAGVSIWRATRAFLDAWAPDGPRSADQAADTEGGGPGGSRLATVYPVIRTAVTILVLSMTVLLALASLGVDILPLVAGAGIVGLAVGFGSQTLVKDIISGMFYLWEDAFRVGEFIVADKGKGVVEKILLRSVRLRHPRGHIYTMPFGSMGTIQNHSRDWVKVKFTFDVPPNEDLERVRKLVKKVGIALSEDPELEGKFIDPMKSQGAVAMVGANYQVGVKFTCPPGQQFLIRRKAYAALQKALEAAGIRLATPRVQVDSMDEIAGAAAATGALPQAPKP